MSALRKWRHRLTSSPLRVPLIWYRHQDVRAADMWVASYPRAGSTWLRFMLFDVLTGRSSEFDSVNAEIPDVGRQGRAPELLPEGGRLIKTHEPYHSDYRRAVYIVRDVRDVLTSEYHYQRLTGIGPNDFDSFFERFLAGSVNGYGAWPEHAASWLDSAAAARGDLLLVKFEELRQRTPQVLAEIVEFLGRTADDGMIQQAIENNSVARMREKEERARETTFKKARQDEKFVRKGGSGGWRDVLSDGQAKRLEDRCSAVLERLGYELTD